jgi:hypothetical protein
MLFFRWINNQEGRLVCAWNDVRKVGTSQNLALSNGKSQLEETGPEVEEGTPCNNESHRDYPVLVWVNPDQPEKSSSPRHRFPASGRHRARLAKWCRNMVATLVKYHLIFSTSKVGCAMPGRVGYCKTFMTQQVLMGVLSGLCYCFSPVAVAEPIGAQGTFLRPIVNMINRQPLDVKATEVTTTFYIIASRDRQKEALALVETVLEEANYHVNNLSVHAFGSSDVEIEARLLATSVDGDELDKLAAKLAAQTFISQAFWSPSTVD